MEHYLHFLVQIREMVTKHTLSIKEIIAMKLNNSVPASSGRHCFAMCPSSGVCATHWVKADPASAVCYKVGSEPVVLETAVQMNEAAASGSWDRHMQIALNLKVNPFHFVILTVLCLWPVTY